MRDILRKTLILGASFLTLPLLAEDLPQQAPQDLNLQTALQAARDVSVAKSPTLTLGAWFERRGKHVYVRDFYNESPAEAAGLKRGDQILAVDGRDDQVMNHLLQLPHGKAVTLEYRRLPWSDPEKVKVEPRTLSLHEAWLASTRESVAWFPLEEGKGTAGYMRVWGVTDSSLVAMAKETYASILRKQPRVVVLDLRGPQPFDQLALCDGLNEAFQAKAESLIVIVDRSSGPCRVQTAEHLQKTQKAKLVGEPGAVMPDVAVKDQLIFAAGHDPLLRTALETAGLKQAR